MLKRLDKFLVGETGLIKKVEGEGRLRRRLLDMGVTPNTTVYLRKKAPLGDVLISTISNDSFKVITKGIIVESGFEIIDHIHKV